MKAAFILFFAIVLLKAAYGQGDAPAMLQGQYQTSKAVGATIQVSNSQVTKINSSTALLETTNNNLLINSGFEHQTYNTSWTVGAGTPSEETSVVFKGKKAFKISLSNQTLSVTQDSTTYAGQYADNPKGIAYAMVRASNSTVKICPRQAGVTSSTCASHSGSGKWELLKVEFSLGATSNGVTINTSAGIGSAGSPTTVYIDDVFVGVKSPESFAACPTTLDCVDTFSFSGSSTATVSGENVEFVSGNGSVSNTSQFTYDFVSGVFSQAPNCVCSSTTTYTLNSQKTCQIVSVSTTQISVYTTANDVNAAHSHNIICQRKGSDFIGKSVQAVASDQNMRTVGQTNSVMCSAKISSTGVISDHRGACFASCTNATTPVCTFVSGFWASTPNCWATSTVTGLNAFVSATTASMQGGVSDTNGNAVSVNRAYFCHGEKN